MAQRTINAKWRQYDTNDMKCHVREGAIVDVVSVVIASTILPHLVFAVLCATLVLPG